MFKRGHLSERDSRDIRAEFEAGLRGEKARRSGFWRRMLFWLRSRLTLRYSRDDLEEKEVKRARAEFEAALKSGTPISKIIHDWHSGDEFSGVAERLRKQEAVGEFKEALQGGERTKKQG